jgi:hypothetical protein
MIGEGTRTSMDTIVLPGMVIGVGSEAIAASMLYAQLTGRPHRACASVKDVSASSNDVVICSTKELTAHLMHNLYVDGDPDGAPGLIFAPTGEGLEELCIKQAAKLQMQRTPPKRVFIHPTLDYQPIERGVDVFLSGIQPLEKIMACLSTRASILSIFAHSDVIDLQLASRTYLCPFFDPASRMAAPEAERLGPRCQVLGQCTKAPHNPNMLAATSEQWIMPLQILRADIAIMIGCSVVRLHDGIIDSSYSLASAVLRQADCGAIVTTWRGDFGRPDGAQVNSLINDICSGIPVGKAVASFNNSQFAIDYGLALCLLGDPCYSIHPDAAFTRLPEPATADRMKGRKRSFSPRASESALLAEAINLSLQMNPAFDHVQGRALASRLSSFDSQTAPVRENDLDLPALDVALLDFLSRAPWLSAFFINFIEVAHSTEHSVCPVCSAPARSCNFLFPMHAVGPRYIIRCASCGDILDVPCEWRLAVNLARIERGFFSVSGIPAGSQIKVCLINLHGLVYRTYSWHAPKAGDCEFRLLENLPPVPLFCRVLIANSLKVGSISFRVRQLPDGTYKSTPRSTYQHASDKSVVVTGRS